MAGNGKRNDSDACANDPLVMAIGQTRELVNRGIDALLAHVEGREADEPVPAARVKPPTPVQADPPAPQSEAAADPPPKRQAPRPTRPAAEEPAPPESPTSTRPEDTRLRLDALAKRLDERLKHSAEATDRNDP